MSVHNVTFYDENGVSVDLNKLITGESRLEELEFNVETLSSIIYNEIPGWIDEDISELSTKLQSKLDTIASNLTNEITNRQLKDSELCSYLIGKINSSNESIYKCITTVSNEISVRIDGVDKDISDLNKKVDDNFETLSSKINSEVSVLNDRIDTEVSVINKKIDTEVSVINDTIDDMSSYFNNKILHDKHYTIRDVSNNDDNYKIKDFSLNIIEDSVMDGQVFYNRSAIGKIQNVRYDDSGVISSLDLVTLNDITDPIVKECFPLYSERYSFGGGKWAHGTFNGYSIRFNPSNSLEESTFTISKHSSGGRYIYWNDIYVGSIADEYHELSNVDNIISGRLELVPSSKSELSAFRNRSMIFNQEDHVKIFDGPGAGLSSSITVVP